MTSVKIDVRLIYDEVRTHPPQFAQGELPQPVASEGEGEDPGVLEGGRQVRHGHVRTLDRPQVVTCRTWLQVPVANTSCKYQLQIIDANISHGYPKHLTASMS